MIGYKGFEKDLTCRGFQYEVGKTYTYDDNIELCESGFHFCKTLGEVLNYYNFSNGHRFCEVEILGDIIEGENKCVTDKIKVVREIEITIDILRELAKDEDEDVRVAVANYHNTPLDILRELSQDKEECVRCVVARNPHTDSKTLSKLVQDEIWYIRWAVAQHPNTTVEDLSKLVQDEYVCVRCAVAKHHNTDIKTLSELAQDENCWVRFEVEENPNYVGCGD